MKVVGAKSAEAIVGRVRHLDRNEAGCGKAGAVLGNAREQIRHRLLRHEVHGDADVAKRQIAIGERDPAAGKRAQGDG